MARLRLHAIAGALGCYCHPSVAVRVHPRKARCVVATSSIALGDTIFRVPPTAVLTAHDAIDEGHANLAFNLHAHLASMEHVANEGHHDTVVDLHCGPDAAWRWIVATALVRQALLGRESHWRSYIDTILPPQRCRRRALAGSPFETAIAFDVQFRTRVATLVWLWMRRQLGVELGTPALFEWAYGCVLSRAHTFGFAPVDADERTSYFRRYPLDQACSNARRGDVSPALTPLFDSINHDDERSGVSFVDLPCLAAVEAGHAKCRTLEVLAARDLRCGDEITMSYTRDPSQPLRSMLRFGF